MTRSIHSTITFVVWSIAGAVSVTAWMSPTFDNNNTPLQSCQRGVHKLSEKDFSLVDNVYRTRTALRVVSQDVSESATAEGGHKIPYVVERGDGSIGGGGLPMPQKRSQEDENENEELRRPKVNAEMPKG